MIDLTLCVCMHVNAHDHACVHVHAHVQNWTCVGTFKDQRSALRVIPHTDYFIVFVFVFFPLICFCFVLFWRQGLSLAWCLLCRPGWLVSQVQRHTRISHPDAGITNAHHYAWILNVRSGEQIQILVLARSALYKLTW